MSNDDRTTEQCAADDALSGAIDRVIRAYYPELTGPRITGDCMVIGEMSDIQNGESLVFCHPKHGEMPMYRQLGLLDYVHTRHRQMLNVD